MDMKKIFAFLLAFCLMALPLGQKVEAQETEADNSQYTLTQEELCNVFPEYSEKIRAANNLAEQKTRTISNRAIEETVYQETEEGDMYSVAFYDDGTYTAARLLGYNYNLTGTETSTSTKYTRKNATLIISDIIPGANRMFTFDQISFTINKNSYDSLDSFYELGTAAIEENGKIVNYSAKINSYYEKETSSRLAGAHFYIANNYFIFQVGNNGWSVILDGGTIISVPIF